MFLVVAWQNQVVGELLALWDEYVTTNGVVLGDRGPFESAEKAMPARVHESDTYPPILGAERMPWDKMMELLSQ